MSLTSKLNKAATIAPLALALVSTTVAAQEKLQVIDPKSADLSKPIAGCVETTSDATAWNKLVTVMNARKQMIVGSGNKLVIGNGGKKEVLISASNNLSGQEGYIVSSDTTKQDRENSSKFCFLPVNYSVAIPPNAGVPPVVNKNQLGAALINHDKAGTKVAVVGAFNQGSLFAINFNPSTHKGAFYSSDAQGNNARPVDAYEDFDYSAKMKQVFESLSSQKPNDTSNSTNAPSTAAPQLKP